MKPPTPKLKKKTKIEVQQHYGWEETGGLSPYEYIRKTHDFLTDDNHEYEDTGTSIIIKRNKNSPEYHPLTPEWAKGEYWFSLNYHFTYQYEK